MMPINVRCGPSEPMGRAGGAGRGGALAATLVHVPADALEAGVAAIAGAFGFAPPVRASASASSRSIWCSEQARSCAATSSA
jgi:hypothetical protein